MSEHKRILVLGGSSFVGRHLRQHWQARPYLATFNANAFEGGVRFDSVSMRLSDAVGDLTAYSHAVMLLGDTQPDSCIADPARSQAVNVDSLKVVIDDLIAAHRDVPSLMPYLHLPVQAGSDRILAAMNRRHTHDVYLRILDRLRDARPDIAFSGDFIVGFPGETDRDFADTLSLVDRVGYASAYSFKYSPRPGTPAAASEDQVPEDVKAGRLEALQQLINAQQLAFNKQTEGRTLDVLVERKGGRDGQMAGRSPYMQAVNLAGDESMIGSIVPCTITDARQNSVIGAVA